MKYSLYILLLLSLLSSCRQVDEMTGNRPIVDTKGVDPEVYEADLQECYVFADEVQAGRKVATGAATGAVVGGVIGAAAGNSNTALSRFTRQSSLHPPRQYRLACLAHKHHGVCLSY